MSEYETFEWTTVHTLYVNFDMLLNILDKMSKAEELDLRKTDELQRAIELTVSDYLAGEDDDIYYSITHDAISQIENSLKEKYLSKI